MTKKRRQFLTSCGTACLGVSVLAGCTNDMVGQALGAVLDSGLVEAPTFEVEGFGIESLGLQNQVLRVDTRVSNPNAMQLTINHVDLSISLAGIDLGQASAQQSFVVPANSSVVVPLSVNVNLINVLNQSVGLLNVRMDTPLPFSIVGKVSVSQLGIPVPVNIQGSITPNQVLGMAQFLAQVAGPAMGLAGSSGTTGASASIGNVVGGLVNTLL